jgi:hypothetical protein
VKKFAHGALGVRERTEPARAAKLNMYIRNSRTVSSALPPPTEQNCAMSGKHACASSALVIAVAGPHCSTARHARRACLADAEQAQQDVKHACRRIAVEGVHRLDIHR